MTAVDTTTHPQPPPYYPPSAKQDQGAGWAGMGGMPNIDPSLNVKEQLAAAIVRQDDLRTMEAQHVRELNDLRTAYDSQLTNMRVGYDAQLRELDTRRQDAAIAHTGVITDLKADQNLKITDITARHIEDVAALRATYEGKLREAETGRINAIRAVDAQQVSRAAEVAAAQATTLAGQVAASAEALRAQVEQTRIQFATTLSAALEPVQKDIADLRRVQYEQAGKVAATNEPSALTPVLHAIEELQRQANIDRGTRAATVDNRGVGQSNRTFLMVMVSASIAFAALLITAAGVAIALIVG